MPVEHNIKESKYKILFTPFKIGKLLIKNRIVMNAMAPVYQGAIGEVTEQLIAYYEARAKGGVGLIGVGGAIVTEDSFSGVELRIDKDYFIPGYSRLVETVKAHGAAVYLQLWHEGIQAFHNPKGPSPVARKLIPPGGPVKELTVTEIEEIIDAFAIAALRAKRAGFDAVELLGTQGHLIQQFISPLTNKRTDIYGKDKTLFAREVIQRIKEKCGKDYPLILKFPAHEFEEGGITLNYAKEVAKKLEESGIDAFHITGGTYDVVDLYAGTYHTLHLLSPLHPEYKFQPEGWFFGLAGEIKKVVNVPVISGGGAILNPEVASRAIEEGKVDAVFLGRQLIAEPEWPKKVIEGRLEEIRPCLRCNDGCFDRYLSFKFVHCTVNPINGFEYRWPSEDQLPRTYVRRKVVIIGGGAAGLEAARIAGIRGYDVTLIEKESDLGGFHLRIAATPSFKGRFKMLAKWYETQLVKIGVNIVRGKKADERLLDEFRPDIIIIATGSKPYIPSIKGVENAVTVDDVLLGKAIVGNNVIIIGGNLIGVETALHLAQQGKEITIVEQSSEIASDAGPVIKIALTRPKGSWPPGLLERFKIRTLLSRSVLEIHKSGITVLEPPDKKMEIPADTVILSLGREPNLDPKLLEKAYEITKDVHVIGDARLPRNLTEVIHEGFFTALDLR